MFKNIKKYIYYHLVLWKIINNFVNTPTISIMEESLHKSYYTIPVKLQAEDNKHMLIHGYTGAIDIVDSNIVNALNAENISSVLSEDEISL